MMHQNTVGAKTCRFCYGEDPPLIQPCNCKGSMAYVHGHCLGQWLETRPSLRCDICNYSIQQTLELKRFRQILRDLIKLLCKRLKREKFFFLKLIIYSAYIVLSCKKAIACYRLLIEQIRKNYKKASGSANLQQTVLCVLYLLLIVFQLAVFATEEIRYFYRVLRQHLRLVCYEITFQDKEQSEKATSASQGGILPGSAPANNTSQTDGTGGRRGSKMNISSRLSSSSNLVRKVPSLLKLSTNLQKSGGGTQGLLQRKKDGTSGLFSLQICDEQATRNSAAAAQQIGVQQFRQEQIRFEKEQLQSNCEEGMSPEARNNTTSANEMIRRH